MRPQFHSVGGVRAVQLHDHGEMVALALLQIAKSDGGWRRRKVAHLGYLIATQEFTQALTFAQEGCASGGR